ncbi:MAG: HAD family hydrolase [Acutalibacteraceae bacterium]
MKYKLVIFDLDGTILDTLQDLTNSVNYALKKSGYPVRTVEEIKKFVGNGILRLIKLSVPNGASKEETDIVFNDFKLHYKQNSNVFTKPYEGIADVIKELRNNGIKTAIVSNKADFAVQDLCKEYFPGCFDYAVGERDGVLKKPAPDSVNTVLKTLGFEKNEAVYIGDSEVDIKTSENADLDCITVTWGFRDEEYLKENGAKTFAHSPKELLNCIL